MAVEYMFKDPTTEDHDICCDCVWDIMCSLPYEDVKAAMDKLEKESPEIFAYARSMVEAEGQTRH
jgi:hypothetical protein